MHPSSPHPATDPTSEAEVRSQLHKTWKEIEDVKDEIRSTIDAIAKANASLIELRLVEKDLLSAAALTASSISPSLFQRIPVDILGEIAVYFLGGTTEPSDESWSLDERWALTYVCRSWRIGILSLPWIWSSFRICSARTNIHLLSTVLQRSANHPLSLKVSLHRSESANYPIFSLLVNHSRRWRDIKLSVNMGPTPLLPLRGQLPQLERLDLSLEQQSIGCDPWLNSNEEQSIFEDAPNLAELKIYSAPFTDLGVRVNLRFPLCQMQRVNNTNTHIHMLHSPVPVPFFTLDNMSNFTNVSSLHLGGAYAYPPPLSTSESNSLVARKITLPSLTSLALESASILLSLRLPSLTSLDFENTHFTSDEVDTITTFLTSQSESFANWQLDSLTVGYADQGPCFIDILLHNALKNLRTLSCDFVAFDSEGDEEWERMMDILTLLIWTHPTEMPKLIELVNSESEWHWTNVMPHLRNLTLSFSSPWFEYGVFDLVREVILSRIHADGNGDVDVGGVVGLVLDAAQAHRVGEGARSSGGSVEAGAGPARLESFRIGYMESIREITMKDLGALIQGKFSVLLD